MSINRGMDKKDVIHIYNGILLLKKNEIMSFAAKWMDLEIILLSEARQISYNITYMWNLTKSDTKQFIKQKQEFPLWLSG